MASQGQQCERQKSPTKRCTNFAPIGKKYCTHCEQVVRSASATAPIYIDKAGIIPAVEEKKADSKDKDARDEWEKLGNGEVLDATLATTFAEIAAADGVTSEASMLRMDALAGHLTIHRVRPTSPKMYFAVGRVLYSSARPEGQLSKMTKLRNNYGPGVKSRGIGKPGGKCHENNVFPDPNIGDGDLVIRQAKEPCNRCRACFANWAKTRGVIIVYADNVSEAGNENCTRYIFTKTGRCFRMR